MGFGADMDKFRNKVNDKTRKTVLWTCFNMSRDIIDLTPVKDGFAKNNWNSTIRNPDRTTHDIADKEGTLSFNKLNSFAPKAYAEIFYIVNSMPYIKRLENGWSKKNPEGMVMKTVARFKNIVKKAPK